MMKVLLVGWYIVWNREKKIRNRKISCLVASVVIGFCVVLLKNNLYSHP